MPTRPTSVTVVAWLLMLFTGFSLLMSLAMIGNPAVQELARQSPLPLWLQYVLQGAGTIVVVVSALAMLKGRNWGRYLYVGWSLAGLAVTLATSPFKWAVIPGALMLAVFSFFLFWPPAARWFAQSAAAR